MDYGLLPDNTEPLPEIMWTHHQVYSMSFFERNFLRLWALQHCRTSRFNCNVSEMHVALCKKTVWRKDHDCDKTAFEKYTKQHKYTWKRPRNVYTIIMQVYASYKQSLYTTSYIPCMRTFNSNIIITILSLSTQWGIISKVPLRHVTCLWEI